MTLPDSKTRCSAGLLMKDQFTALQLRSIPTSCTVRPPHLKLIL